MKIISCPSTLFIFLCSNLLLLGSCSRNSDDPTPPTGSENKLLKSFTLTKPDGTAFLAGEYAVAINADSVIVTLPPLENRKGLKATMEFTGKSIFPANGSVQDFSAPVTYTITGGDGSIKTYTIEAGYAKPKLVVFIGAGNTFYALDAGNGTKKWSFTGGGSFAYSSATYRDNVVYVGCIDNNVYAFNATNGRLLWQRRIATTGIESDAVIADSTVYVGTNDDYLYALDAVTGITRWTFRTGGNISSSPKLANGKVYFGSSDGRLYALEAKTGQMVWYYQTGGMLNQSGSCLVNNTLYVGSRDGYLYAINEHSGTLKWRYGTGAISFESSSPTVHNGVVYIGGWYNVPGFTLKGSVYAVNAATGSLVWEKLENTGFSSSPFVNDERFCITGDNGKINVLQTTTGNTLWQKTIYGNSSSPVEANGVIYVGGPGTGFIYAFDAKTGNEMWKFPIPGAFMASSPVVIDLSGVANYPGDSGIQN
jgi:eukaryotic-like serine/threonine-protein kinase